MGTFIVLLLLVLLFFNHRLKAVGRELGEGIRNFKRGLRGDEPRPSKPKNVVVEPAPPKLLPAKGESSAPQDEPPESA